ncbi:hypothetical protein CUT44_29285 [Streptomyces carminius]|uniref:Uncharacterized protein n=1 Tax=Streptomyces carminius TaxID=2665496 RepID=A0A2M8LQW5_9ACTN|nr:hypothetical protein [Streptomyces carminius]PJE94344.1 hypothetical protein CUT44_29285 [Streptomyces carminius]
MRTATVRRTVLASGAALAVAAALAAGLVRRAAAGTGRRPPGPPRSGTTTGAPADRGPAATGEYWTPGRMRNAGPAPMPEDD